jgi:predicted nucleic acid-binding protein
VAGILDTNVVVRYLIGDSPDLAAAATAIVDSEEDLYFPGVAIAETAYVLSSVYSVPREVIVDHLVEFIQKRNVKPLEFDKAVAIQALLLCRESSRVSFADAMVWAAARASGVRAVYSLDERFPSAEIEVRRSR